MTSVDADVDEMPKSDGHGTLNNPESSLLSTKDIHSASVPILSHGCRSSEGIFLKYNLHCYVSYYSMGESSVVYISICVLLYEVLYLTPPVDLDGIQISNFKYFTKNPEPWISDSVHHA